MAHGAPKLAALACLCFTFSTAAFAQVPQVVQAPPVQIEQAQPLQVAQLTNLKTAQSSVPQTPGGVSDAAGADGLPQAGAVRAIASQPNGVAGGLVPLFVSYAALQALDVHSTLTVINRGGFERNPVIAPLVNHWAAFVAYKVGLTTAAFFLTNRLSKRNRVTAYVLLGVMNSAYAIVIAHNYRVAAQMR